MRSRVLLLSMLRLLHSLNTLHIVFYKALLTGLLPHVLKLLDSSVTDCDLSGAGFASACLGS